jgi:outer membrane protein assembly factor BamB
MSRIVVLLLACLFVAPLASADESGWWPQFRGPNGRGVSSDEHRLPVEFGPSKKVLWKTALPEGHSSPCIWSDRIFLTSFTESDQKLEALCLDRRSGQILWRRAAPAERIESVHTISSPAASTPVSDGQRVYVYFGSFGLLCYDFNGNVVWQKPLAFPQAEFGSGTSPMLFGDLLILNDQGEGSPLLAVSRQSGETAWTHKIGIGYSVPVVWRNNDVEELIVLSKNRLTSFQADGTQRWFVDGLPSDAITTPVIGDGLLFVNYTNPGGDQQDRTLEPFGRALEKYDKNKDSLLARDELPTDLVFIDRGIGQAGKPGGDLTIQSFFARIAGDDQKLDEIEWNRMRRPNPNRTSALWAIRPVAKGVYDESQRVWQTQRGLPEIPSPLYYRGHLYFVRKGGIASCLEGRTGKVAYQQRLPVPGSYYSSPIAGDGKIYVASENGALIVIEAGPRLNLLAKNVLGERIMATPAIASGTLFVRTEKTLFAFRETDDGGD